MSTTRSIKSQFDDERLHIRTREIPNGLKHFWTSNDHIPLAEDNFPGLNEAKRFKEEKGLVNLFVGEADIFSVLHKIEGDIIICDIDRALLKFIEDQKNYLIDLYKSYKAKKIDFDQVFSRYKAWIDGQADDALGQLEMRMFELGNSHFMDNEKNFNRSMESLQTKNLSILDINLFDTREQDALCSAIKSSKAKVKVFNLTNLPDYDGENKLLHLLNNLPWAEAPHIIWNIHDRGAFTKYTEHFPLTKNEFYNDPYIHYLFTASNPAEYRKHVSNRPDFFAKIDVIDCVRRKIKNDDISDRSLLSRYAPDSMYISKSLIEQANPENRKKYIDRLDRFFYSVEGCDINAVAEKIYRDYGVRSMPRGYAEGMKFFTKLLNERDRKQRLRSSPMPNCSNPFLIFDILSLIDVSIEKLQVKRTQKDLALNKLSIQTQLDEDSNQISFLIELANKVNTIRVSLSDHNALDEKPIIDKCKAILHAILLKAQERSIEFRQLEGQNEFKKDIADDLNQISFLSDCLDKAKAIRNHIACVYEHPDHKHIIDESRILLADILGEAGHRFSEFKKPEGQAKFKKDMIAKIQQHKFKHEILDTEKHNILKVFLNAIMLIPIFGVIKWALTGTFFFHAATRREQIFVKDWQSEPSNLNRIKI